MILHLKKNLRFMCLFVSVGFIIGLFYTLILYKPAYKSTASVLIQRENIIEQLYIIRSGKVAGKILGEIQGNLEVKDQPGTNIVSITATSTDPVSARDMVFGVISEYRQFNPDITVIEFPEIPTSYTFPGRMELLALFIFFSIKSAMSAAILKGMLKNSYYSPEQIEQDIQVPVLGVIPWLDKDVYEDPDIMFAINENASYYSLAFQKAISCLKLKGYNTGKRVFAFTSSEFTKDRSTIVMNIAYSLSRSGESVVVVDGDFRTPSLGRDLDLNIGTKGDLGDLLANYSEEIEFFTYSFPGVNNLYVIPNNGTSEDPSLYLHSEAFKRLIHRLRIRYNWVLIDVPPVLAVPDAFMVGNSVDGVVLMTGLEPEKSAIKTIYNQFKTYEIELFGVIMREIQTKEAVSANSYIKQMINRMIAQGKGLVVE